MWFWVFMLGMDLLIPFTMILFGRCFAKRPPKEINALFGYRTARSMKNKETWAFAHQYCGQLWKRIGFILLPLSIVPLLFVWNQDVDTIGMAGAIVCFAQLIPLIGSILPVELALKKNFDSNGRRSS